MEKKHNKVFVIGVDGMDPKTTRRMVNEGKLPNIKKLIELGSAREDLMLLGANPTITPPMWTTMATGAYPMTHGITCYWNQNLTDLSRFEFAFDSRQCVAEQVWNCIAEAGKKVLVWTWPSSWPPSSANDNLHVVGNFSPSMPNCSGCDLDSEHITHASIETETVKKRVKEDLKGGVGCINEGEVVETEDEQGNYITSFMSADNKAFVLLDHHEGEELNETPLIVDTYDVPLKQPVNWGHEVPADALEFPVIISNGTKQLPSLLLKNETGIYDHVEIYWNKKASEPIVKLADKEFFPMLNMEMMYGEQKVEGNRHASVMKIDPEGKFVEISMGKCLDHTTERKETLWHPNSLYQQAVDAAGYVPYACSYGGGYPEMISQRVLPSYRYAGEWQTKALLSLIKENHYDAVFTHFHNCDHVGHPCWRWAKSREKYGWNDEKVYQGFIEQVYMDTDDYVGRLMPLLDEGWTLILTSDHGLLCSEEDDLPLLGEGFVMNVGVLRDLGYTVVKKDKNGKDLHKIDWEKTKAVSPRGNHIYINLKGRNKQEGIDGIVDPADKYELERQIIDDLYNYRMNGKRVVNLALRNKDAVLLGLTGERCGDIIYFLEEGFNRLHGDSLSTTEGYFGTSVSPLFIAAGSGVKSGYQIKRVIKQVDLAPTIAAILGVRQPADADGAIIYQILAE